MRPINPLNALAACSLAVQLAFGIAGCSSAATRGGQTDASSAYQPFKQVRADGPTLQVSPDAKVPTQSAVADLVERISPTVVNITTTHTLARGEEMPFPFGQVMPFEMPHPPLPRQRQGAGTGFIVDVKGYIVTNAHVVEEADEVKVHLLDDRELTAQVVGRDEKLDLALLKVSGVAGLPAVVLGDSDALRVGEQVLAVGNPFGLGHSVSLGIVSAKERTIGAGPYDDFIQTDASINPGNSGGPLFNLRGEVIGINTAIRAGAEGIGFAIPIDVLKDVMGQLRSKGYVERGKLGLTFQPITSELAAALGLDRPHGALVNDVLAGGPADKAGIHAGDVIVAVDGNEIHHSEELARNVAKHAPGSACEIKLLRQDKALTLQATLDKLDDEQHPPARARSDSDKHDKMLGLEVDEDPNGGVRIVAMNKPVQGLRPGDVIVEVGGKPVRTVDQLRRALDGKKKGDTALLKVKREGKSTFVGLPVE